MMKKIMNWVLAATLICGFTMSVTSCEDNSDNPAPAKKKYRLVQCKQVFDDTDTYYITDYSYDDQGRLASYEKTGYNTRYSDGPYLDSYYTYTYGDHYIIERDNTRNFYNYYTLNDDGLVVKQQVFMIEDGVEVPNDPYYLQYEGGRILSTKDIDTGHLMVFYYDDDDLVFSQREDVEESPVLYNFTPSTLSVDHGYIKSPMSIPMTDELYMMGYFGKPSKHLVSHERSESNSKKTYTLQDRDYTYTIADGHIVEMVEVTTTVLKSAVYNSSGTKTNTTTFTYEEVDL